MCHQTLTCFYPGYRDTTKNLKFRFNFCKQQACINELSFWPPAHNIIYSEDKKGSERQKNKLKRNKLKNLIKERFLMHKW